MRFFQFSFLTVNMLQFFLLLCLFSGIISAKPFLHNTPQILTSLVSSASAASSGPASNVASLRHPIKLQDSLDDDDFFKDSFENNQTQNGETEASPNFLQKKLDKIVRKVVFLTMLGNRGTAQDNDDDFQKAQDEFDKEYEEDMGKQNLMVASGYFYNRPSKLQLNSKQEAGDDANKLSFNPGAIGVFFMELIGSLVGLVYGATAQMTQQSTTTSSN